MSTKLATYGKKTRVRDKECLVVLSLSLCFLNRLASEMGWHVGFKLHLLCNEKGEIVNFVLTKANVDDRNENVFDTITDKVFGKSYADKGYISQSLF
ncbi:MAG: transposase [Lachnoclostridium sp.]|nr:transposase [Lachnoclostridium sp.]